MILNRINLTELKIYARKCQIKVIDDNNIVRNFLEENHIQGLVGSKVKLGLYFNNELVSLMTLGNLRKSLGHNSKENHWELLRFCNKLNTYVIGVGSKLFNFFLKNYKVDEVISYSKNDYSTGKLYQNLNFKLSGTTTPNYYWVINVRRVNRFNFRKDKLVQGWWKIKT
jgi:hypothetical protein